MTDGRFMMAVVMNMIMRDKEKLQNVELFRSINERDK